jgi:hypothetical protein
MHSLPDAAEKTSWGLLLARNSNNGRNKEANRMTAATEIIRTNPDAAALETA